jgi:uncharacterized protein (DUF2249 family)
MSTGDAARNIEPIRPILRITGAVMSLTTYGTKIDLRDIPQRDRPALVLNTYRLLQPGQTMELVNEQDPKPLYDQLQERDPGGFGWDYLESGPDAWRVRVMRITRAQREDSCCSSSCACS